MSTPFDRRPNKDPDAPGAYIPSGRETYTITLSDDDAGRLLPRAEDEQHEPVWPWPGRLNERIARQRPGRVVLQVSEAELRFLRGRVEDEIANTDDAGAEVYRDLLARLPSLPAAAAAADRPPEMMINAEPSL